MRDRLSVRTGQLLLPSWAGRRVLRKLRDAGRALKWPQTSMLETHSFRSGAARAIVEARGTFVQLLNAGQWVNGAIHPIMCELLH